MHNRLVTPLVSDINITPLTDVMLVLLIIFMIASPFLRKEEKEGEELKVPKVETAIPLGEAEHLLVINADGTLVLDEMPIEKASLGPTLEQLAKALKDTGSVEGLKLYIAADEKVTWKQLAEVMSIAKLSKIERLGMVQELLTGELPPLPEEKAEETAPVPEGG
jgi:biopolymer transport protein ExbD